MCSRSEPVELWTRVFFAFFNGRKNIQLPEIHGKCYLVLAAIAVIKEGI